MYKLEFSYQAKNYLTDGLSLKHLKGVMVSLLIFLNDPLNPKKYITKISDTNPFYRLKFRSHTLIFHIDKNILKVDFIRAKIKFPNNTEAEIFENATDEALIKTANVLQKPYLSGEAICSILLKNKNPVLAFREAAGISQQKLADAIGVSNVMISKIEKGKTKGGIAMFAIAKFFNVDLCELIKS